MLKHNLRLPRLLADRAGPCLHPTGLLRYSDQFHSRMCVSRGHALAFTDPSNQASSTEALEGPVENQSINALPSADAPVAPADVRGDSDAEGPRRQILIGSQRDPVAYRARQRRDWKPIDDQPPEKPGQGQRNSEGEQPKPDQGLGTSVPSEVGSGQSAVGSRQPAVGSVSSAAAVEPVPRLRKSRPPPPLPAPVRPGGRARLPRT